MDILFQASNFLLNVGIYLEQIINILGPFTYLIVFLIIFLETGLVIAYFLPGDSLVFLVGALAGTGKMNLIYSYIVVLTGAILGDSVNYWIGRKIGPKVFKKDDSRIFNKKYLKRTHDFFEKHGKKTIIISRFIPMLRTFAPFVAGIGTMDYKIFLVYNIIGAFIWATSIILLGYFLGSHPLIRNNYEFVIFIILGIFTVVFSFQFIRNRIKNKKEKKEQATSYEDIKEIFVEDTKKS
jgi:membrane-associated protein